MANEFRSGDFAEVDGRFYYGTEEIGTDATEVAVWISNNFSMSFPDAAALVNRARGK